MPEFAVLLSVAGCRQRAVANGIVRVSTMDSSTRLVPGDELLSFHKLSCSQQTERSTFTENGEKIKPYIGGEWLFIFRERELHGFRKAEATIRA